MRGIAREERALPGSNLGAVAQNARLRGAVVSLTVALALTVMTVQSDASKLYRLFLFLPYLWASIMAIQGLYRTCPMHVNKRTRVNEAGEVECVASEEEIARARCLAHRVLGTSLLSAVAATTTVFLLP